jgi:adenine-specific DNA-methyltransferase
MTFLVNQIMEEQAASSLAATGQGVSDPPPHPAPPAPESPLMLADQIGQTYLAQCTDEYRKQHGLYFTPPPIAAFMASMLHAHETMRILDPAAGSGTLLCAVVEHLATLPRPPRELEVVAYEVDAPLATHLQRVLDHVIEWAHRHGIRVGTTIRRQDFILAEAAALRGLAGERFDIVIANPPYFKISKADPRAVAAHSVVHGQPNIYGLFLAVGAALLHNHGELVSITPRSFAAGPYFRRFRERFFSMVRPLRAHVFTSRRDAFSRDEVLQENVILHAVRQDDWAIMAHAHPFTISSSAGIADLDQRTRWYGALTEVIDRDDLAGSFRLPTSPADEDILRRVDRWPGFLHAYGLAISTGPVVPFRATRFLMETAREDAVPLLWMHHIRAMTVHWPNGTHKPQHIANTDEARHLLIPNHTYVLLRRFSSKEEHRRIIAAPLLTGQLSSHLIGLENHLNYIYRPGGQVTEDEAFGLAALLNSALLDGYIRCSSGNTQVSATELRALPLPPLAAIIWLGRQIRNNSGDSALIDRLVDELAVDSTRGQQWHVDHAHD